MRSRFLAALVALVVWVVLPPEALAQTNTPGSRGELSDADVFGGVLVAQTNTPPTASQPPAGFVLDDPVVLTNRPPQLSELPFDELRAKAEQGDAEAQYDLAGRYRLGRGVAKDEAEAFKWYRKAAEQGNTNGQYLLGIMYELGLGIAKDEAEAAKWYRKVVEKGQGRALFQAQVQFQLGSMYVDGRGVAKDEAEAVKWYRKAAEQGYDPAQFKLGRMYSTGDGVAKDEAEAVKWYRMAAEQGNAIAQNNLAYMYSEGLGVTKDDIEAVRWYRMAAEQGLALAQYGLGYMYNEGRGVTKDESEAVRWMRKAAEQGDTMAQNNLGAMYSNGNGVIKDEVEAYKWHLLAGAQGDEAAKMNIATAERQLTPNQRAEGQRLAREWKPRKELAPGTTPSPDQVTESKPNSTGTAFAITEDGYFITNEHVVEDAGTVRLLTSTGLLNAKVVRVDKANDLALLKVEGRFPALPLAASRGVRLGATVATVGFPNPGLQGFAPKFAKGEVASLSGAQDDARQFQVSIPIQPGNSGGAMVDERGNVVGVIVAKLSQKAALATSGTLAENVNYAIKSSFLLGFLESVPEVASRLKDASTKARAFEDVVQEVEKATALVLVY